DHSRNIGLKAAVFVAFKMSYKIEFEIDLLPRHDVGRRDIEDRGLREHRPVLQQAQDTNNAKCESDHFGRPSENSSTHNSLLPFLRFLYGFLHRSSPDSSHRVLEAGWSDRAAPCL